MSFYALGYIVYDWLLIHRVKFINSRYSRYRNLESYTIESILELDSHHVLCDIGDHGIGFH